MVSSTGMTCPIWAWVASLYCRQNSMMFTPCWPRAVPTGGAGVACPARIWSLTMAETFLRLRPGGVPFGIDLHLLRFQRPCRTSRSVGLGSGLRHLVEGQLDRRFAVEDVHQDLQLGLFDIDLRDGALEVGERASNDPDHVTLLPLQAVLGLLLGLFLDRQDLLDFTAGQWRGLGARSARHEAGHPGRVAHHVPRVVVVHHLDEQVAGKHLSLDHL